MGLVFASRERNYFILIGLHLIRAHYETGRLKAESKNERIAEKQAKLAGRLNWGNLVAHAAYTQSVMFYNINSAWRQLKGLVVHEGQTCKQTTSTPTHRQTHTPSKKESRSRRACLIQKFHFRFSLASTVWHKSGKWGGQTRATGKMRKYRTQGHTCISTQSHTHIH